MGLTELLSESEHEASVVPEHNDITFITSVEEERTSRFVELICR
jgi:hypothetical protein